ncbi:undecaprenyl-diphosphatase UppP [Candidatus Nomurabacteria bacterium]|nr:undecaprenyl-diphosphatase UppP [Candidatus Nomurabacteria bacterium]
MDIFHSVILGVVQGLTEFLPVSSSGHLIIFRDIFGLQVDYGLAFDAVLQLATTLAVFIYFRKDILKYIKNFFLWVFQKDVSASDKNLIKALIWGTVPAIILGLMLEDLMDSVFRNSNLVALSLIIGSLIMLFAEKKKPNNLKIADVNAVKGFIIGLFQALALVPGMSRSGMTISGGLFSGFSREEATRFSFLLAFPILVGSGLKKLLDLFQYNLIDTIGIDLLFGSVAAFIVGLLAIHFLIKFLKNHSLKVFVWYRVIVAVLILLFI